MNKYVKLIDEKLAELKTQIAAVTNDQTIAKSTRGTQRYKLSRDRRILHLIKSLITDSTEITEENMNTFVLLTTLESEKKVYDAVVVKEGDSILQLAEKYDDRKDPIGKIKAACDKAGLVMNYSTGLIEKSK